MDNSVSAKNQIAKSLLFGTQPIYINVDQQGRRKKSQKKAKNAAEADFVLFFLPFAATLLQGEKNN